MAFRWWLPTGERFDQAKINAYIKQGYDETTMGFVVHDLHRMISRYCIERYLLYSVFHIISLYFEIAIDYRDYL